MKIYFEQKEQIKKLIHGKRRKKNEKSISQTFDGVHFTMIKKSNFLHSLIFIVIIFYLILTKQLHFTYQAIFCSSTARFTDSFKFIFLFDENFSQ